MEHHDEQGEEPQALKHFAQHADALDQGLDMGDFFTSFHLLGDLSPGARDANGTNGAGDDRGQQADVNGAGHCRNRPTQEPSIIPKASEQLEITNGVGLSTWDDL